MSRAVNPPAMLFGGVLGVMLAASSGGTLPAVVVTGTITAALSGIAWVYSPSTTHNDGIVHRKSGGGGQ